MWVDTSFSGGAVPVVEVSSNPPIQGLAPNKCSRGSPIGYSRPNERNGPGTACLPHVLLLSIHMRMENPCLTLTMLGCEFPLFVASTVTEQSRSAGNANRFFLGQVMLAPSIIYVPELMNLVGSNRTAGFNLKVNSLVVK